MNKRNIRKLLAAAGLTIVSVISAGCAGPTYTQVPSSQESSSAPPFIMPGESVMEATLDAAESETETAHQTVHIDLESTGEAPPESSSEENTEPPAAEHVVMLDPGHGGVWTGALDGAYQEKDLALRTALYCRDYLLANYENVTVYLTRDSDTEFSYDQKEDLEERVKLAKSYNAEILVSLHFNSDPTNTTNGSLVCVSKQSWVAEESSALANSILNQLSQLGLANRGLLLRDSEEYFDEYGSAMDYYAICRHSASVGIPGIIVEHCFMRNETDRSFYSTDEALQRLGQADAMGIAQFLGLQYRE